MPDEKRPFLEHLEELRRRIIFSGIAVIILSALSYTYAGKIVEHLARYVGRPLVFISPQEAFLSYLRVALSSGVILSVPVILFNILRFILLALDKKEKRVLVVWLAGGVVLFAAGGAFAYFLALPIAMKFLLGFSSNVVQPFISIAKYISFCVFLMLAFAIAFETPLFIVFLAILGLVDSAMLRRKRRYIIVVLFITAAVLTPPDVITQVLLALPLMGLYEISIWLAKRFEKRKYY